MSLRKYTQQNLEKSSMKVNTYLVNLTWLKDEPQDCVGGMLEGVLVSELRSIVVAAQPHTVPRKARLARWVEE